MTAPALPMSVAIVNFNTRDVLDECLASVKHGHRGVDLRPSWSVRR